jgi:Ankyrin repeats (many copies)
MLTNQVYCPDRPKSNDIQFAHVHDVARVRYDGGPAKLHMPSEADMKKIRKDNKQRLTDLANKMVTQHTDLNSYISFDWDYTQTLLSTVASHKCCQSILQLLLDNGANPNQTNKDGSTPIQKAATSYCAANVSYLLSRGARFDFADKDKKLLSRVCDPSLDGISAKTTRRKIETIRTLVAAGADPNTNVLHFRITFVPNLLSWFLCHSRYKVKLGLEEPEHQNEYHTFLDQRKQMICVLLEAGLDPFKQDEAGKTDWDTIKACKDRYDENLFKFTQEHIDKIKLK